MFIFLIKRNQIVAWQSKESVSKVLIVCNVWNLVQKFIYRKQNRYFFYQTKRSENLNIFPLEWNFGIYFQITLHRYWIDLMEFMFFSFNYSIVSIWHLIHSVSLHFSSNYSRGFCLFEFSSFTFCSNSSIVFRICFDTLAAMAGYFSIAIKQDWTFCWYSRFSGKQAVAMDVDKLINEFVKWFGTEMQKLKLDNSDSLRTDWWKERMGRYLFEKVLCLFATDRVHRSWWFLWNSLKQELTRILPENQLFEWFDWNTMADRFKLKECSPIQWCQRNEIMQALSNLPAWNVYISSWINFIQVPDKIVFINRK